ncbi:MAG TPA: phospholipase [Thermoanaerobaculia bacterium]|nr:phospholipase [Thermoanaerobaculia bacterium]
MEVRIVEATVHGRALVERRSERWLVGFHGYAETAETMLAQLRTIPGNEEWSLLAIQALHPFYTREQKVVANWMTSLDRELAIEDNVAYVQRVLEDVNAGRRVFLGFSQGVAMAFRAAAHLGAAGVIALGADVPPDVADRSLPPALLARGLSDDWYTAEKFEKDLRVLKTATRLEFAGGHEWTEEFRDAAAAFLKSLNVP